ncbi:hypothetical protein BHE74_00056867 [Ensete ventricosum]|uniref:Signal peptidase complex subunit 2 n=1 Tax=Ensete ventricosum TaxID=4639 RepID=A0A444DKF4_ENSVE|nr:hypothetical protein B296_00052870 [Ensete ventricosum]RWV98583.1 hypothetical protein GW17_00038555 [Ensete ventricosum]RWW37948.1 hypothetical protein BHE74_00056867 [Ensete ventricosum]
MASSGAAKNRKKANLVDHYSIKHLLDESVTEVASLPSFNSFPPRWTSRVLLVRLDPSASDWSSGVLGWRWFVFGSGRQESGLRGGREVEQREAADRIHHHRHRASCAVYVVFNGLLQFISYRKEKNAFLFTYPPPVSFFGLN